MKKRKSYYIIAIFFLILILFSPPPAFAKFMVYQKVHFDNYNQTDGCGFNCNGCGVQNTEKVLFGRKVSFIYACGLIPADLPEYHESAEAFVSFIGTVKILNNAKQEP